MTGVERGDLLQRRAPPGVVETGDGVDEVAADPGEPGTADLGDGGEGACPIVDPAEEGEHVGLQALDPRLTRLKPASSHAMARASLVLDGFASRVTSAPGAMRKPARTSSRTPASRLGSTKLGVPPPTNTVSSSTRAEPGRQRPDLGPERRQVLGLAVTPGEGDEVAVLAATLAEGDVEVEGADPRAGGRAVMLRHPEDHRPDRGAGIWRGERRNIRETAGYTSGTTKKPDAVATSSATATPAPVVDPSVLTSR